MALGPMGARRTLTAIVTFVVTLAMSVAFVATPAHATPLRVNLRVLVVNDGGPTVAAIVSELQAEGVPYTSVNLSDAGRPAITADYLATPDHTNFQAIVLPNETGGGVTADELTAIHNAEQTYGLRQLDAYTWANPGVGLNYGVPPLGYIGSLDGVTATVTPAGLGGPFSYLRGPVGPFETGTYAYPATPVDPSVFTTLVGVPIPSTTDTGSIVGVYTQSGREEMVVTAAMNYWHYQFRLLAPGMVEWLTKGIHLGYDRDYLGVHVDDVFAADSRWSTDGNCTPGDDCTNPALTTTDIRMLPADVQNAVAWEQSRNLKLDMVFNGGGSVDFAAANGGQDPTLDAYVAAKASFRWINHTYTHEYLGCLQNLTVVPWVCQTDAQGKVQYYPEASIESQIGDNATWAQGKALPLDTTELVTGEHSGLFYLPQMPVDSPNLVPALTAKGVKTIASDASRDPNQRAVGGSVTVPRHPMNIFYNVGTKAQETDEYNWIYTSRAQGGSGICEDHPDTTTCLPAALDTNTGFDSYIVPLETTIGLRHVLTNDPRPHFVHQSNLAEDRIVYPVLDAMLNSYRAAYADNTPLVQPTMTQSAKVMGQTDTYNAALAAGRISAITDNGNIVLSATGTGPVDVPLTAPEGTHVTFPTGPSFGEAYAGQRSAWITLNPGANVTIVPPGAPGAPNTPPVASFTTTPAAGNAPVTVAFNASASSDVDGPIAGYAWNFGDGAAATGVTASHTYSNAGTYTATLTVTDNAGATASTTRAISVNAKPIAKITVSPASGLTPLIVNVSGSGSSDADGTIASYSWNWGDGITTTGVTSSHGYVNAGNYTLTLTVTDNKGATATATQVVAATLIAPPTVTKWTTSKTNMLIIASYSVTATFTPVSGATGYQLNVSASCGLGGTNSIANPSATSLSKSGNALFCYLGTVTATVRTYRTVAGATVYSNWSPAKTW